MTNSAVLKYFFHSPLSKLPIPDVTAKNKNNKNSKGQHTFKTEPHLFVEPGLVAENWLKKCYARTINKVAEQEIPYLFWTTNCQNPNLTEHFNKQYIVGYLEINHDLTKRERPNIINGTRNGFHTAILGKGHFYSFKDAILTKDFFGHTLDRIKFMNQNDINEEQTESLLEYFSGKTNILQACMDEIRRIDTEKRSCWGCENPYCTR